MNKRRGIVDRIEGKWAVIEFDDGMRNILLSLFPESIKSGDVMWMNEFGYIQKDEDERQRLSQEIDELMDELWED